MSIAAPVGPIGVLVIRRTLVDGRFIGFISGMGAAAADTFYGILAAFGLTAMTSLLLNYTDFLRLGGGLFLLYVGMSILWKTGHVAPDISFNTPYAKPPLPQSRRHIVSAFMSTFALTIANPMTILAFIAIFAGFSSGDRLSIVASLMMVAGIFIGSACWWLVLSLGISLVRSRMTDGWLVWINRLSSVVIVGFAVAILLSISG